MYISTVAEGYGTACTDNIQCSTSLKSGGICSNNTCVCADGYHYFLGKCWKSAGILSEHINFSFTNFLF